MRLRRGIFFILVMAAVMVLLSFSALAEEYSQSEAELLTESAVPSAPEASALEAPMTEAPVAEVLTADNSALDATEPGTDADVSNPLAPKEGSAQIVEYVEEGSPDENRVDELIEDIQDTEPQATDTTVNDVPSVTHPDFVAIAEELINEIEIKGTVDISY